MKLIRGFLFTNWATKKKASYFRLYWLDSRDPYNIMVYFNPYIYIYNWVGFHPLYNPTNRNQGPFFWWLESSTALLQVTETLPPSHPEEKHMENPPAVFLNSDLKWKKLYQQKPIVVYNQLYYRYLGNNHKSRKRIYPLVN